MTDTFVFDKSVPGVRRTVINSYERELPDPQCCRALASIADMKETYQTDKRCLSTCFDRMDQRFNDPALVAFLANNPLDAGCEIYLGELPKHTAVNGFRWSLFKAAPGFVVDICVRNLDTGVDQVVYAGWNLGAELVNPEDPCLPGADVDTDNHHGAIFDTTLWGDSDNGPNGYFQKANHELVLKVVSPPTSEEEDCSSCCKVPEWKFCVSMIHADLCHECDEDDWQPCCD